MEVDGSSHEAACPLFLEPQSSLESRERFFIVAGADAQVEEDSDSDDGADMEFVPTMAQPKRKMGSLLSQVSGCSGIIEETDSPNLGTYKETESLPTFFSRQASLHSAAESCGGAGIAIAIASATTATGFESSMSPTSLCPGPENSENSENPRVHGHGNGSSLLLSGRERPLGDSSRWSQSQTLADSLREESSNGQPKASLRSSGRLRNSFGTALPGCVGQEEIEDDCASRASGASAGFRNTSSAHVNVVMSLRDSRRSEGLRTVLQDAKSAVEARFQNFEKAVRALLKDTNPTGGALCSAFEDLYQELSDGGGFSKSRTELARCFQAVGLPGKKTASISLVAFKRLGRCQDLVEAIKERWGSWAEAADDFASRYGERGRFPLEDLFCHLSNPDAPDSYHAPLQELAATFNILGLACEETSTIAVADFRHLGAIEEIYHAVVLRWGTFDKATGVLLGQKRIQGKLIPIEDLWHEIHEDNNFPHGTPELALALSALGIGCNEKSAITSSEFRKLAAWEDNLVADVAELQTKESTLHQMQVQRILMNSLNLGERLLARISAALKEVKFEFGSPGLDAAIIDLEDAVMVLHEAVSSTNSATCMAEAVTSPYGLRLMLDIIQTAQNTSLDVGLQLVVVQLLSASISRVGGPAFVSPVMVTATSTGRANSNTLVTASNPRRSIDVLKTSQAVGATPRAEHGAMRSLQDFEQLFMAEVWLPLLKSFDPDDQELPDHASSNVSNLNFDASISSPITGGSGNSNNNKYNSNNNISITNNNRNINKSYSYRSNSHNDGSGSSSSSSSKKLQLPPELLQSLLGLFLQVRMPSVLVGSQGSRSAPDIEAELLRLHSSDLTPATLHQALSRFDFLEELDRMSGTKGSSLQGDPELDRQVSVLAAGLCGRRLLLEALERLQGALPQTLLSQAAGILHKWDRERRKLASRYGMTGLPTSSSAISNANGGQIDVLAKAALTVAREGYIVSWPDWGEVVEEAQNSPKSAKGPNQFHSSPALRSHRENRSKSPKADAIAELDGVASHVAQRLVNREEFISKRRHRPEEARLSMSAKLAPIDHPMHVANAPARTKTLTTLTSPKLKNRSIGLPLQPLVAQKYGLASTCLLPSVRP